MRTLPNTQLLAIGTLMLSAACSNHVSPDGEGTVGHGVGQDSVIVGSVSWSEVQQLAADSPERANSLAVAHLSLPAMGSRCTGFLIAPDVIMTNEHCIPAAYAAQNVSAIFGREAGNSSSDWDTYRCDTFLGNNASLDYALLQCDGRPGDTWGVVDLDDTPAVVNEDVYVIHQNCDYYSAPGCEPSKKYSPGRVTRVDAEVRHDADTLGGSSGSPVFRRASHQVFALHHVGLGNNGNGRGSGNYAVPMSRIVPDLASRFPSLALGGGGSVAAPPGIDADALEPNDDLGSATELTLPFASTLSVHAGDTDVLRIDVDGEGTLLTSVRFSNAAGDIDIALYEGTAQEPTARSTTTGDEESFSAEVTAGTYYLVVYGYQGASNDYTVSVALEVDGQPSAPEGDAFEPNEAVASAAPISSPFEWNALQIADAGDLDHFRVDTAGPFSARILFDHAEGDLDLHVFDAAGSSVGSATSTTDDEALTLDLPAGAYVICVLGYNGATGGYDLRVAAQ